MEFDVKQIPQIGPRGNLGYVAVLRVPDDQRRRPVFAQVDPFVCPNFLTAMPRDLAIFIEIMTQPLRVGVWIS